MSVSHPRVKLVDWSHSWMTNGPGSIRTLRHHSFGCSRTGELRTTDPPSSGSKLSFSTYTSNFNPSFNPSFSDDPGFSTPRSPSTILTSVHIFRVIDPTPDWRPPIPLYLFCNQGGLFPWIIRVVVFLRQTYKKYRDVYTVETGIIRILDRTRDS